MIAREASRSRTANARFALSDASKASTAWCEAPSFAETGAEAMRASASVRAERARVEAHSASSPSKFRYAPAVKVRTPAGSGTATDSSRPGSRPTLRTAPCALLVVAGAPLALLVEASTCRWLVLAVPDVDAAMGPGLRALGGAAGRRLARGLREWARPLPADGGSGELAMGTAMRRRSRCCCDCRPTPLLAPRPRIAAFWPRDARP